MPVQFQLSKLTIQNFRGIQELELDLPSHMPMLLIGGNNAGKSTIINALALTLRGGGMHMFTPTEYDYFHSIQNGTANTFSISLHFLSDNEVSLPAVQGVGSPVPVHGIRVLGKTDKKGKFDHRRVLLNAEGNAITFSHATVLKGEQKDIYRDQGLGWNPVYARIDDIKNFVPEVWRLEPDNLYSSLYEWKNGPLKKISKLMAEKFLATSWTLDIPGDKPRKMPDALKAAHHFFHDAVKEFPFWKNELKPKLDNVLSTYVGRQARIDLQPDIQTVEEWLTQQLVVAFAGDSGGAPTPLHTMGQGWQSLVRLACLEVLSQLPDTANEHIVLLFEEPETFLHPHLSRKLRGILETLAEKGWLVVATTHAADFVSFSSAQKIVRLARNGDTVEKTEIETSKVAKEAKFQERLDERGGQDMLFAQRVIICEGKDDTFALKLHLSKCSTDLDGRSISVIKADGVGTIPIYAEIASKLGIPWCAVTDQDLSADGAVKPNTAKARERLTNLKRPNDKMVEWKTDLEACLSVPSPAKANPEWLASNLDPLDRSSIQSKYPDFYATAEAVREWAEA